MPQSKTKKSSSSNRSKRSGSSSNGARARSSAKPRTKASTARTRSQATKKSKGSASGRASASKRGSTAKRSSTSKRASTPASRRSASNSSDGGKSLAQKAKVPALAAGAALIGLAGGATATKNARRKSRIPKPNLKMPRPDLKKLPKPKSVSLPKSGGSTLSWVEEKARQLGDAGHKLADVTNEAAEVQKSIKGGK
jgi:hypothetical protein